MINPKWWRARSPAAWSRASAGVLYEEMAYDPDANPLATTFMDYLIPTVADVPDLSFGHIETPSASLGGYKGMGEGGAIASPAAVANAVNDALRPLDITISRFPITPPRIREAIQATRHYSQSPDQIQGP